MKNNWSVDLIREFYYLNTKDSNNQYKYSEKDLSLKLNKSIFSIGMMRRKYYVIQQILCLKKEEFNIESYMRLAIKCEEFLREVLHDLEERRH